MRPFAAPTALALAAALGGCVERRIEITSEPSGALVYVNDQQVGRTPTEAEFLFHGVYDVRVELEGYEPLRTEAETKAPVYEWAPIDLVAEAIPVRFENVQRWHFELEPALEASLPKQELEQGLLDRAAAMRDELGASAEAEEALPEEALPEEAPPEGAAPADEAGAGTREPE